MTCSEFTARLMDYLSDELSRADSRRSARHLQRCAACVAYLRSYEQTVQMGQAVRDHPDDPIAADAPEDLVQAILASREGVC